MRGVTKSIHINFVNDAPSIFVDIRAEGGDSDGRGDSVRLKIARGEEASKQQNTGAKHKIPADYCCECLWMFCLKETNYLGRAELNSFTSWKDLFISQFSCTRSWLRVNVRRDALTHWFVPFVVCHWMGCVQDSKHTCWSCTAIHIYDIIQSDIVCVGSHLTSLHTGKGTVPHTWLYNARGHLPCIMKKQVAELTTVAGPFTVSVRLSSARSLKVQHIERVPRVRQTLNRPSPSNSPPLYSCLKQEVTFTKL